MQDKAFIDLNRWLSVMRTSLQIWWWMPPWLWSLWTPGVSPSTPSTLSMCWKPMAAVRRRASWSMDMHWTALLAHKVSLDKNKFLNAHFKTKKRFTALIHLICCWLNSHLNLLQCLTWWRWQWYAWERAEWLWKIPDTSSLDCVASFVARQCNKNCQCKYTTQSGLSKHNISCLQPVILLIQRNDQACCKRQDCLPGLQPAEDQDEDGRPGRHQRPWKTRPDQTEVEYIHFSHYPSLHFELGMLTTNWLSVNCRLRI